MIFYPHNLSAKIGFDQIRLLLEEKCVSELGREFVRKMQPIAELTRIEKLGHQTAEFKRILDSSESFPSTNYYDARKLLSKAKVDGAYLDALEFHDLKGSLTTIFKCLKFLRERKEEYPLLFDASNAVVLEAEVIKEIEEIVDESGKIRDNASADLKEIRREILSNQSKARRSLDTIIKKAQKDGLCPDDVSLTIRSGRLVIPVLAEYKRQIKGFIHDESASGQTVYLEPTEVLDINNEIRDLEYRERREIIRILTILTASIRTEIPHLEKAYRFLGMIDFIRAKAKLAVELDAVWPAGRKNACLKWYQARHPLLMLSFKQQGRQVVPLSIELDSDNRILLISGPNAGGKSVCLKTVALLQYMYQSGLMVPVAEGSEFGIFEHFFIDIGDEQSIENDLSTYSSHLTNMKFFLANAGGKSLLLIDEFGTGTEPQFGGAIAEAILKQLRGKNSFGVITTHYANLKKYAEHTKGILNGAMRFDPYKLEPLYELEVGKPGSSFALEIAGKIGLPAEIVSQAKKLVGHSHVKFDQLISELEADKTRLTKEQQDLEKKTKALDITAKDYSDLKEFLEQEQKAILRKAKEEAKQIVSDANRQVEATIRAIKESQASKETTKKAREELRSFEESVKPEPIKAKPKETIAAGKIKVGDRVRLQGQDATGEVLSLKGKKAELSIGDLKSTVNLDKLEKLNQSAASPAKKHRIRASGVNFNEKAAQFSGNLDLRGKRAEEAIGEVDYFIDQALLLGQKELRIVHGKGHGILRDLIRQQMRSNKLIESAQDEHIERGGSGVTVVKLK